MDGLLNELGKKLAERWLSLLVLPGVFYLAVGAAAYALGQTHPLEIRHLSDQITHWAKAPMMATTGGRVVILATILAGAAAAGLVAQGSGSFAERLILAASWRGWPFPFRQLVYWRVVRRRKRWNTANAAYLNLRESAAQALVRGEYLDPGPRFAARRAMNRIAVELPDRPTRSGDRVQAVAIRLDRDLHVELATIWPYLWLTVPDAVRAEIAAARQGLTRATTLIGWAVLYAFLIAWWWPAIIVSAVLAITAKNRIVTATENYAVLLETTSRLYLGDLVRHLGIDHTGPLTPGTGEILTEFLASRPHQAPEVPNQLP
jgi:hypothetical protein